MPKLKILDLFSIENGGNNEAQRLSGKCSVIAISSAPNSVGFQRIFGEVNEKMKMRFEMDLFRWILFKA